MNCRQCASSLTRPGDYCLVCGTRNCDIVVLDVERDHATLTFLFDEEIVGRSDVRTTPEPNDELTVIELRNFAGRIADELQRKRPDAVYATGDREVIQAVRAQAHYDFYRVSGDDPVEDVLSRLGEPALDVVSLKPKEKLGGSHTTLIGERDGQKVIMLVAAHPNVKKIIPGPIDAGGSGSRTGVRAKATRADKHGNVRLLLRDGSSVQENRVVTTASDREMGERVRDDLNDALAAEGYQ